MAPDEALAFVRARSQSSPLKADSAQYWRQRAAIRVRDDGRWELDPTHDAVRSAREAVRERITVVRRWAAMRPDPAAMEANRRRIECEREAHRKELAAMRRVLVHAFPAWRPEAVVLVDVAERKINTFNGQEIAQAIHRLAGYEIIGAVGVRALLQALNVEAGERRLAELGPPQRTKQVDQRGRTRLRPRCLLKALAASVVPLATIGPCANTCVGELRRSCVAGFDADAKSLYALYQYGRLHGAVRLRWGFLDEMLPAPLGPPGRADAASAPAGGLHTPCVPRRGRRQRARLDGSLGPASVSRYGCVGLALPACRRAGL
jgi:hypothetical protein